MWEGRKLKLCQPVYLIRYTDQHVLDLEHFKVLGVLIFFGSPFIFPSAQTRDIYLLPEWQKLSPGSVWTCRTASGRSSLPGDLGVASRSRDQAHQVQMTPHIFRTCKNPSRGNIPKRDQHVLCTGRTKYRYWYS